mmetsp:Transcript_51948/g.121635  ORF Transcript_51948/g.121635 Transcript_51948/m.121635 type:complete len:309 (+) Transcript_51948:84-1010(+)
MLSPARSTIADRSDIVAEQERQRFLRNIGVNAAYARVRTLSRKAKRLELLNPHKPAGLGRSQPGDVQQALGIVPPSPAPLDTPQALQAALFLETPRERPGNMIRSPRAARPSPRAPQLEVDFAGEIAHDDYIQDDEVKKRISELSRKFRDDLVYEWRHHEVSLQQRPTAAEKDDPSMRYFSTYRRPHTRVVVGRDEREIRAVPEYCINEDLKQTLLSMRENLFHRRLNMAIYERSINQWRPEQIRAQLRRQKIPEAAAEKAGRRTSIAPLRSRTGTGPTSAMPPRQSQDGMQDAVAQANTEGFVEDKS